MLEPYTSGSIGAAKNDNSGLAGLEIYLGVSKGRRSRHRTLYLLGAKHVLISADTFAKVDINRYL
jgi:hypothetical protein